MYSNRYVALHCCQNKYIREIEEKGIERETKAVFICQINIEDKQQLLDTLAVSIYHGIDINNWKMFLDSNKKDIFDYMNDDLSIVIGLISKEQEKIIDNKKIKDFYNIINSNRKTLEYCKIKDIGIINNIKIVNVLKLKKYNIKNKQKINPINDRFFIKNSNVDCIDKNKSETINEIKNICYKIAKQNITKIKNDIEKIKVDFKV